MPDTMTRRPTAFRCLARLWTEAANRTAVTAAAATLDRQLRDDPWSVGESRSAVTRIALEPPLHVDFDVSEADCLVTVWAVW